jgi:hypothetical protein
MDGTRGLGAWRWLFIIEGAATIVIAMCCGFVLPNFPRTTKWLTEEEKALAVWYVAVAPRESGVEKERGLSD